MFNKNKKNNKGFTLVELLVVIAIIGILAVVAVPSLMKNIEKSKVASLEADINAIKSVSLSYYADKNQYPTTGSTATPLLGNDGNLISPFNQLLDSGLANKYKAQYSVLGTAPGPYTLKVDVPGGIGTDALNKLTSDLGATTTATTTGGDAISVVLIKGNN